MVDKAKNAPYVCSLSDDLIKGAREELNEIPERRAEDIDTLRKKIQKLPSMFVLSKMKDVKHSIIFC
jgi:hypothetical protein